MGFLEKIYRTEVSGETPTTRIYRGGDVLGEKNLRVARGYPPFYGLIESARGEWRMTTYCGRCY